MATPTPSRAPSRSPRRNPNGSSARPSPRSSIHSSPPRGPLLERSDSQKNSIYRQTPFPTLPSQVFAPKGDVYVFGDSHPSSEVAPPAIPPKSPTRLSTSSGSWVAASRGKQRLPDVPSLSQVSTVDSPDAAQRSNVRRRTLTSASRPSDNASVEGASSAVDAGESSQMAAQRAAISTRQPLLASTPSTESFAARTRRQQAASDQSPGYIPHHKSVDRLRSQSSMGSMTSAKRRAQAGQLESSRSSEERPRSSSSPSTPTDAFIQALISSGTNIQYPKLRKPSATSLRSESTVANAAYPPPLRLQRKRANSQLAKAASIAPQSLEPLDSASDSSIRPTRLRGAPSQNSFLTQTSDATTAWAGSYPAYAVAYTHPAEEVEDTVAELHPRSLKRQRSDYQDTLITQSDKTSRESFRSSVGSFYHFLNDSRTAWAQVYYRGEGKLRLETPPGVEDGSSYETPDYGPRSSSLPGQRHSPGSGGFPDRIYVPRVRPLPRHAGANAQSRGVGQGPSQIRAVPQESSSPYTRTDSDSSIIPHARPRAFRSSSTNDMQGSDSGTMPPMQTFWKSSSSPYNTTETDSSTNPHRHYPRRTYSSEAASSVASRNRPLLFDSSFCPLGMTQDSSHSRIPPPHRDGYSFGTSEDNNHSNGNDSITALPSNAAEPTSPIGSQIFNPTPAVPHLSLSKRHGPALPYWRTPSFDDRAGVFDKSNIQVALFCIGFLVPPVWWIAAFCPIPTRPQWDRNRTNARIEKEQSIDLFDTVEVYRYQKAQWWRNLNRFMALAGVLIVAAVVCLAFAVSK